MQPRLLRSFCAILVLALLAALAVYAWRGTFSRYLTDDYCSASKVRNLGFATAMSWHWTHWSGRYSYFAIKAIPELIGPSTAPAMPAILIALFCAAAVRAASRIARGAWLATTCGFAIVFAAIDATPEILSPFGSLLWETGSVTYLLPLIFYTTWFALFFEPRNIASRCVLAAALMLVAGGLSETSLAAQIALTGGALFVTIVKRMTGARTIAIASFASTLASAVILASAPGNQQRLEELTPRPLSDAVVNTFRLSYDFIGSNAFVDGISLVVVLTAGLLLGMTRSRDDRSAILLLALTAFGAFLASIFPSAWVLANSPPPRALQVTTFFFVLTVFALAVAIGIAPHRFVKFATTPLLIASIVVALLSIPRVTRSMDDGRRHAAEADRVSRILSASAGKDLTLRAPYALAERMVFADPSFWTNRCICDYYGVRTLTVTR